MEDRGLILDRHLVPAYLTTASGGLCWSTGQLSEMKRKWALAFVLVVLVLGLLFVAGRTPQRVVLTGIVTTDEIIVGSEIQGRVEQLLVNQGDVVKTNQLLALIKPQEWKADYSYYSQGESQAAAEVRQAEAALQFQQNLTSNQVSQAEANLAAAESQVTAAKADQEIARLSFEREEGLYKQHVEAVQAYDQARTTYNAAKARVESQERQVQAARAAVALAEANADQVAVRRAALESSQHQMAAAEAQKQKAAVRLGYTEIRSPADAFVDIRAALPGEIVTPGQAVVTLVDPDNLWVRADVEETYIDRIHLGDKLQVRLPSGAQREGTVFFRGVDADYATQRDVSRTKRDIKTFEIRLRCDNRDRSLALGMTAYVTLPLNRGAPAPPSQTSSAHPFGSTVSQGAGT